MKISTPAVPFENTADGVPRSLRSSSTPPAAAYLISVLTRQLALGADAFAKRYQHSWLVWEPGGWAVPSCDGAVSVAETRLDAVRPRHAPNGDALCFVLEAPEGGALRVGRAVDNEIIISEPSVSRFHVRLELRDEVWRVVPVSDPAIVGDEVVGPGSSQELFSGQAIELGGVRLSFYDPRAFKQRVATVPLRPAAR